MAHPIPESALDDRLAFVGTSGSGKTYAAGTAVERILTTGAKVVVVDPLDVWYGLRVKADGVRQAFPVIIFGGAHADIPITEHAGSVIGEAVASMSESCIVSLSTLGSKSAERRFMLAFLEALYRKATGEPFHLIFDEADLWAPQRAFEPQLQSLMENIVRRGRVKGFIPWLITQRPAVLSKDILSQADGLIAMKLTSSQDRSALQAWIEGQADRKDEKQMLSRLPRLKRGEGVIWLPGLPVLEEATFPEKKTFDSSQTPKRGQTKRTAALKPIDLGALTARLASIEAERGKPAKGKAPSPAGAPAASPDPAAVRVAEDRARAEGFEQGKRVGRTEGYQDAVREAKAALSSMQPNEPSLAALPARPAPKSAPAAAPAPLASTSGDVRLPVGERAVLTVCAQYANGATRSQITVLTNLKRSTRDRYILYLKQKGLVDTVADRIVALSAGRIALGSDYQPLPTGAALRAKMIAELPDGEARILAVLCDAYPRSVSRDRIEQEANLKRSTRDRYILYLRARELAHITPEGVRASDDLFSEAA